MGIDNDVMKQFGLNLNALKQTLKFGQRATRDPFGVAASSSKFWSSRWESCFG